MIREGTNGVMMIIRVDLRSLVKFGTVSLRTGIQRRYPGALVSSDNRLRSRRSPLSSYRENMKFEYKFDPFRRSAVFSIFGRSGFSPKKYRFACNLVFRNELLICEVRKILSGLDSRKVRFGVRTDTPRRFEVV